MRVFMLSMLCLLLIVVLAGCPILTRTYTITATAGSGGIIYPSGAIIAPRGSFQQFHMIHDLDHLIEDVLVDGISVGPVGVYAFDSVTQDHTIHVSFYRHLP